MASNLTLLLFCHLALCTTMVMSKACDRPSLRDNMVLDGFQRVSAPGDKVRLSCKPGYQATSGDNTIVCDSTGKWTRIRLECIPRVCPTPQIPPHLNMEKIDYVYQSIVNYTCEEGYILHGANSSECLADGTWSEPTPECKPVTCGPAPIPKYGTMVYDNTLKDEIFEYGFGGTYDCLPPFVLFGNVRGSCTAHGNWTEAPECKIVTCPPPRGIWNGYMTTRANREHSYKEKVRYSCNPNFSLVGPVETECQETGEWSLKPVCKAHCPIDVKRGTVLYIGRKVSVKDLEPKQINHLEMISFYCKDKARECGYPVSTQCIDGKLNIPACFDEPGWVHFDWYSGALPSEMPAC